MQEVVQNSDNDEYGTLVGLRIPVVEEENRHDDSSNQNDEKLKDEFSPQHNQCRPSSPLLDVPDELITRFQCDGFVVCNEAISLKSVNALNRRLEYVLRGYYDRNIPPDKIPRRLKSDLSPPPPVTGDNEDGDTNNSISTNIPPQQKHQYSGGTKKKKHNNKIGSIGFSGNLSNVKTIQIININKADSLFRKMVTCPALGYVVAKLAGWTHGARLAQDQIWAKPPGAPPLVFHRDSPYFMFDNPDVVTVWIAFDDMTPDIGPLQYIRGSHLWGDGRIGSSNQFFNSDVMSLVKDAALKEGITDFSTLDIISMAGLRAGSLSIHHGKLWHGSPKNTSTFKPRRGIGLHFVPADVKFTLEARHSKLWSKYVTATKTKDSEDVDDHNDDIDPSQIELPEDDFPIVYQPTNNAP